MKKLLEALPRSHKGAKLHQDGEKQRLFFVLLGDIESL
jgi:hypothetical protein